MRYLLQWQRGWSMQLRMFTETIPQGSQAKPFKTQLLKWVGNKQRYAHEIIGYFPNQFGTYVEPFLGTGGVLGTLAPKSAVASDALAPLITIFKTLKSRPDRLKQWYRMRWERCRRDGKVSAYEAIKASYNRNPNAGDLVFLSRACYGGVVRFRTDGHMSTPCGAHAPISPEAFSSRVDLWRPRIRNTQFLISDFEEVMEQARPGDLVYCDPPYRHTQAILYGSQQFTLERLLKAIEKCKERSVYVVLSIDGSKKTGAQECALPIPRGLFEEEALINCGRSMLRRFQMSGRTLESEIVEDRLLLTYRAH